MSSPFSLSLSSELSEFVEQQSGEGTQFPSPAEYIRALIRERKERHEQDEQDRVESRKFCESLIGGLQDIIDGRTYEFKGSIDDVIKQAQERRQAEGR